MNIEEVIKKLSELKSEYNELGKKRMELIEKIDSNINDINIYKKYADAIEELDKKIAENVNQYIMLLKKLINMLSKVS